MTIRIVEQYLLIFYGLMELFFYRKSIKQSNILLVWKFIRRESGLEKNFFLGLFVEQISVNLRI